MKDLPDLHAQRLDEATVAALFADIAALSGPVEVRVKGAAARRAGAALISLAEARIAWEAGGWEAGAWEAGAVRAVQLRYVYEGTVWLDTLIREPDGARLVRMRQPEPPSAAAPCGS